MAGLCLTSRVGDYCCRTLYTTTTTISKLSLVLDWFNMGAVDELPNKPNGTRIIHPLTPAGPPKQANTSVSAAVSPNITPRQENKQYNHSQDETKIPTTHDRIHVRETQVIAAENKDNSQQCTVYTVYKHIHPYQDLTKLPR